MSRWRTPAIVLRRWPYSETSLSVHLLTPAHGVAAALAKGVQRPTSGAYGVLDTWALVEVELGGQEGQAMHNLYAARLLERFPGLSAAPERLAAAGLAAELAELAAPPGTPTPAAFEYLLRHLQAFESAAQPRAAALAALLEGLDLLGVGPVLDQGAGARWFSPALGGVLPAGAPRPLQHARRASAETLAWLRALRAGGPAPAPRGPAVVEEALTILGEFAAYHLERPPRAWPFLRARRQHQARQR